MAEITNFPMRKALKEHRRSQIENGYIFDLAATSIGQAEMWSIRVRYLSMMDEAVIKTLPRDTQEAVFAGMNELQRVQEVAAQVKKPNSLVEMVSNNATILKAADKFFCAVAIEPEVVMTEADLVNKPDAFVVSDFAGEDRVSLFIATVDSESAQARKLRLFRPGQAGDVPAEPPVRLVENTTVGDNGAQS